MKRLNVGLSKRRVLETAAMMIIGDSVLAMLAPRRHVGLWAEGPAWWERTSAPFLRRPQMTRLLGLAGLGLGVWLARRSESGVAPRLSRYKSRLRRAWR